MKDQTRIYANQTVKIILSVIAVAGVITLAALAPNAVQLLKLAMDNKRQKYNRHYYFNKVAQRLIIRGLVKISKNNQGQKVLKLTNKGKQELEHYRLKELTINKPKHWDNKYRVIIFDIKEWKRGVRDRLRQWLTHLGFVRLQNSVWVHPYECREVITLLKSHFKVGKEVLYLTVESIENDYQLKRQFNLCS